MYIIRFHHSGEQNHHTKWSDQQDIQQGETQLYVETSEFNQVVSDARRETSSVSFTSKRGLALHSDK